MAIPAALYLRMSTEHQKYSFENQTYAVRQYATVHDFEVIHIYSDPAKSGLLLKNRTGLRQLLVDVAGGKAPFRAILVYDVSRWGRFQDTDESAHYEFLCKSAGIPVHYCAEQFTNDGSILSSIIKNLKRVMAGEYSRELSVKVFAGQKRLAELGFKQGGPPGLGYRRMLVSADGNPKHVLAWGERKYIATDRVRLVVGPPKEVECVRGIFRMYVVEKLSLKAIARELNRRKFPSVKGGRWTHNLIVDMLSHPKYIGCNVFNQSTGRLGASRSPTPRSQWIIVPGAHEAIIDQDIFDRAQARLAGLFVRRSNDDILENLKALLAEKGKLDLSIIARSGIAPSGLRSRFGGVRRAYKLIGYGRLGNIGACPSLEVLREDLLSRIHALFPDHVYVTEGKWGLGCLRLRDGTMCTVQIARWVRRMWRICASEQRLSCPTLIAMLNPNGHDFSEYYLFSRVDRQGTFFVGRNNAWLQSGRHFTNLCEFGELIQQVR